MGREKNSIHKLKEMKLNLALVAAVAAEWNGQSLDSTCGMQISTGQSMVNSTCTISGSSIKAVYAGNGAFITSGNTFTGFDGVSGEADVVVFFNQNENADGSLDNSTCWDAAVNCVDNGAASAGVFFMETVNAAAGVINLQIAGVSSGDVVSIELNDDNGNNVALTNITSAGGEVSAEEANGAFSVTAGDNFGDLLQVSVNAAGVVNLWQSSVSN